VFRCRSGLVVAPPNISFIDSNTTQLEPRRGAGEQSATTAGQTRRPFWGCGVRSRSSHLNGYVRCRSLSEGTDPTTEGEAI
jgi:hypothetical protein